MTRDELKAILDKHVLWLEDKEGGICADLSEADLSDADLSYADLRYANLNDADLSRANLSYADLRYAYFIDADLSRANLSYANLSVRTLSGAILSDADLIDADRIEELEAKLRKLAVQVLSTLGQEMEAYQSQLAAEAKLERAVEALKECEDDIDAYIQLQYPYDHPVQETYRQRDYATNPARVALAELTGGKDE